jgi:signal peptidase II
MMLEVSCVGGGEMQIGALVLTIVSLIVVDQAAKAFVVARFAGGYLLHRQAVKLKPLAILWLGELLLFGLAVEIGPLAPSTWAAVALGAALGGGASNMIDRARRGGVVDFIDLKIWPAFNIADAAIVIGATGASFALLGGR